MNEINFSEKFRELSLGNLMLKLESSNSFNKAHVLDELTNRLNKNPLLAEVLFDEVQKKENLSAKIIGNISVSSIGFAGIIRNGSDEMKNRARKIIDCLNENNKKDIIWFLKSEGLID